MLGSSAGIERKQVKCLGPVYREICRPPGWAGESQMAGRLNRQECCDFLKTILRMCSDFSSYMWQQKERIYSLGKEDMHVDMKMSASELKTLLFLLLK